MRWILLLAIIVIIIGCSDDDEITSSGSSSGPPQGNVLIPLQKGNSWTYETKCYHHINHDSVISTDTNTYKIISMSTIEDEQWYTFGGEYYFTNRSDGLWIRCKECLYPWYYKTSGEYDGYWFYKYPAQKGESYDGNGYNESFTTTIIAIDTTILANGRSYNCIGYKSQESSYDPGWIKYYEIGIGHVRSETWGNYNGKFLNILTNLIDYDIR